MPNKGSTNKISSGSPTAPDPASEPSLATLQSTSAPTDGNTANIKARRPRRTLPPVETGALIFSRPSRSVDFHHNILNPWNGNNTVMRSLKANLPLNLRMAEECLSKLRGTSTIFSPSYNCLYDSPRSLTLATLCTASSSPTAKNTSSSVVVEKATDSATPRKAPNNAGNSSPLSRGKEKAHRTEAPRRRLRALLCMHLINLFAEGARARRPRPRVL